MYVVADKMMPAEEPEQSEHKIVFEIDYSHFISFHGWIQLLQLVRKVERNTEFNKKSSKTYLIRPILSN